MKKQKVVTLDLSGCQSLGEIHQRIKKAFDFPDFYGENWDAFEDMLTIDCPVNFITVKGINTINKELRPYIEPMKEIMEAHKQQWIHSDCPFDYQFID